MPASTYRRKRMTGSLLIFAVMTMTATTAVLADAFGSVHYDAKRDQIVVTMIYDGTHPNHHFAVHWGRCHTLHDQIQGPGRKIINLGIVDEQGNDAARKRYTKVVRVSLADLSCRPATVTLWTSPNQFTRLDIP